MLLGPDANLALFIEEFVPDIDALLDLQELEPCRECGGFDLMLNEHGHCVDCWNSDDEDDDDDDE
jgi:hypothetical protein